MPDTLTAAAAAPEARRMLPSGAAGASGCKAARMLHPSRKIQPFEMPNAVPALSSRHGAPGYHSILTHPALRAPLSCQGSLTATNFRELHVADRSAYPGAGGGAGAGEGPDFGLPGHQQRLGGGGRRWAGRPHLRRQPPAVPPQAPAHAAPVRVRVAVPPGAGVRPAGACGIWSLLWRWALLPNPSKAPTSITSQSETQTEYARPMLHCRSR